MKTLIENVDYYVRYARLANRKNSALIAVNDDGTFDIYLNTLCTEAEQEKGLKHELDHLMDGHFYTDLPIQRIEAQANGEAVNIVLCPPDGYIPHFYSEENFAHWAKTVLAQCGKTFDDLPSII